MAFIEVETRHLETAGVAVQSERGQCVLVSINKGIDAVPLEEHQRQLLVVGNPDHRQSGTRPARMTHTAGVHRTFRHRLCHRLGPSLVHPLGHAPVLGRRHWLAPHLVAQSRHVGILVLP